MKNVKQARYLVQSVGNSNIQNESRQARYVERAASHRVVITFLRC